MPPRRVSPRSRFGELIPKPAQVSLGRGSFPVREATAIALAPATDDTARLAAHLADEWSERTGGSLPMVALRRAPEAGTIRLTTRGADPSLGAEGYELRVDADGVELRSRRPAGLFYGVQTLLQLLPAGATAIPAGVVRDRPRFEWRGAMLDVARHFFRPAEVKLFVDVISAYKLNRLHLHLTDDQGWRLEIASWPRLALHGGKTAVGGGRGGFYTQAEFSDLVRHAADRHVTVVPEIDMPGHTNAALAAYPELSCDGRRRRLYTGIEVGFSSLCIGKPIVDRFVAEVLAEVAALTPGPYLHVGGDEAKATRPEDYRPFVQQLQRVVRAQGKRMIGWEDVAAARLRRGTIAQHWASQDHARRAVAQGARLIMSPATRTYLDIKYDTSTKLGLSWVGATDVRSAYSWDPASVADGVGEADVLGIEAPLWTETTVTMDDVWHLAAPRLLGHAEIGWSPQEGRSWSEYRRRLGTHGQRLDALGVGYYPAPEIPWVR
jgi:hexosaminidase